MIQLFDRPTESRLSPRSRFVFAAIYGPLALLVIALLLGRRWAFFAHPDFGALLFLIALLGAAIAVLALWVGALMGRVAANTSMRVSTLTAFGAILLNLLLFPR